MKDGVQAMNPAAEPHLQTGSAGTVERQFFTFAAPPDELVLESGARLGPITIAYETWGRLTPARDNVILVLHAFSGDSHAAGYLKGDPKDAKPGWWDSLIGPGKGLDTDRYFVICSNILGGCMGSTGPSSINPNTGIPYGLDFPMMTIGDIIETQKALLGHLGIDSLHTVIGGSVGGMQVLEWCVRYPEMVRSAIPVASTMRHSALAIAFNEIARQAIMADPRWRRGNYYGEDAPEMGLAVARMIGHVTYLSDEAMRRKFGRRLQGKEQFSYGFDVDFQVESYLRHQGSKFVKRFDANSLLYITKAADYFDLVERQPPARSIRDIAGARTRFLVISYSSDWLYPTYQSKELVKALKRAGLNVSFCEIEADCGHDAFLIPDKRLGSLVGGFLANVPRT